MSGCQHINFSFIYYLLSNKGKQKNKNIQLPFLDKRPDYLNTIIYLEVAIKEASFIYAHIFPNTKLIFKNKPVSKLNHTLNIFDL